MVEVVWLQGGCGAGGGGGGELRVGADRIMV